MNCLSLNTIHVGYIYVFFAAAGNKHHKHHHKHDKNKKKHHKSKNDTVSVKSNEVKQATVFSFLFSLLQERSN